MKTTSNLEEMLNSNDPETVRLALTVMGYKEDKESFDLIGDKLTKEYKLLLYLIYEDDYTFYNLALYDYKKKQDMLLRL
jgi:hypothetical protein